MKNATLGAFALLVVAAALSLIGPANPFVVRFLIVPGALIGLSFGHLFFEFAVHPVHPLMIRLTSLTVAVALALMATTFWPVRAVLSLFRPAVDHAMRSPNGSTTRIGPYVVSVDRIGPGVVGLWTGTDPAGKFGFLFSADGHPLGHVNEFDYADLGEDWVLVQED